MSAVAAPSREQILHAAAALFLAQGFEATSMEQVRQRAGVSNGSLYHHYPTRNHRAHLCRRLGAGHRRGSRGRHYATRV